jgi:mRNA interferase RelE/StbE
MNQIHLIEDVENDLDLLEDEIYNEAYKYLKLLEENYEKYSLPLYDMDGRDLKGCRKTYFCNAEYRIVSKLENGVINIINVIAVGKREDMEVYKTAHQRLNK